MKKLLIGGAALVALGSDRRTDDTDYLIFDPSNKNEFIHAEGNIDYINAAANKFFAEIWELEKVNNSEIASPQALLELKAYALTMHCRNFNFFKADQQEYDIKFLVRKFGLKSGVSIVKKYVDAGAMYEINKFISSVKFYFFSPFKNCKNERTN